MLKSLRVISLIGLTLNFYGIIHAQSTLDEMYSRITTYDGLSSNTVKQTIADHNGYIYFATANGLDRYDGKNFKQYKHDPLNDESISHNIITSLLVDNKNRLWVGTNNGLNLKGEDDTFKSFSIQHSNHTSSNKIDAILQDHAGRIWVGTQKSLCLYDEENNALVNIALDTNADPQSYKEAILSLHEDKNNILWVASWKVGLTVLDLNHKDLNSIKLSAKRLNQNTIHNLENNNFSNLFEDGNNRLWGQQYNGHLYSIDIPLGKNIIECTLNEIDFLKAPIFDNESSEYSCQIFSSLYSREKGLYLNTNSGFIFIEEDTLKNWQVNSVRNNFQSMKDFSLVLPNGNSLFEDSNGLLWVSSDHGVFKYFGNQNLQFEKQLESYCTENSLTVISFYEQDSKLWLGTDKGLYLYNTITKELEKVNYARKGYETLKGIWDIEVAGNRMWLGTISGQLYYISDITAHTLEVEHIKTPGLEDLENNNHIWEIKYIDTEQLYLATHQGLFIYDINQESNSFNKTTDLPYMMGNNMFDIVQDEEGRIWTSVTGHGLYEIIPQGSSVLLEYKEPTNGNLKDDVVFDLELSNGNIWIASTSGIQKYNIGQNEYFSHELLDNKVTNQVLGIESHEDNIFFVTSDGLYIYNEVDDNLRSYNHIDGLVSNTSILGISKSQTGKIYLGGTNGYNVLSDLEKITPQDSEKVVFTDFKLSSESVLVNKEDQISGEIILIKEIGSTSEIALSHKHKFISLDFGVLDYIDPNQYSYRYRIEGLDNNWNELGNKQSISLTNLNPGNYTIQVKGKDKYNNQTEPASLSITVTSPIWQRAWFILLSFLIGLGLFKLFISYNQKKIIKQKKELEKVVKERTQELSDNNHKLKLYIESNLRLEQFAHAASHDLKSPLRTISSYIGLLRMKMKNKLNKDEIQYFDYIEGGTGRLHDLINDMLEFAKINSDKIKLRKVSGPQLIDSVLQSLQYTLEEKKAIVTTKNIPSIIVVDPIKFPRVIQNLVSNALKFVDHDKVPIITILGHKDKKQYSITVKDNGIGISPENQVKIFDIFSRVAHDNSYDGTGMGLAISKKIIECHGGQLSVKSKMGKGSAFKIEIPNKIERPTPIDKALI